MWFEVGINPSAESDLQAVANHDTSSPLAGSTQPGVCSVTTPDTTVITGLLVGRGGPQQSIYHSNTTHIGPVGPLDGPGFLPSKGASPGFLPSKGVP